jgi:hypothetical protein
VDRARHAGVARPRRGPDPRAVAFREPRAGGVLRGAVLLALTASFACSQLGTDLDQAVAVEVVFPDSGRIDVNDTLRPHARALNGRGDSVAATIVWASLDTGIVRVVDSTTGVTFAKAVGTGRLQARAGTLRSNPQNVFVLPLLDTAFVVGNPHVVVTAPDSLSDSLVVQVHAPSQGTNPLAGRRVAYAIDSIYSSGGTTVTFVPRDTIRTGTNGTAAAQLRFLAGPRPDSVVVTVTLPRSDPNPVAGTPLKFVVEYSP